MAIPVFNNNNNNNNSSSSNVVIDGYPQSVQNMVRAKHPDYDQVMSNDYTPQVNNSAVPPVARFVDGQNRVMGKFESQPVVRSASGVSPYGIEPPVVRHPDGRQAAMSSPIQHGGYNGMYGNPTVMKDGELDSLSQALSGISVQQRQAPPFQSDPNKKDGGFFGWINSIVPKKRPGRREGESDDEYDRRRTTNMQMWATFADAIRHMGNIVNTSNGAPVQKFNDPNALLEQGYQSRKAQRQKKAALAADAAYKQANLSLKERAAEADRVYKTYLAELQKGNAELARKKFDYQISRDAAADQYKKDKDKRDFVYKQGRDKIKDQQTERRLNISQYNATHKGSGGRSGKGGSGSGGKYWFEDKNGNMRYQPNKTMWEQEYYREYGKLPDGETSVSTSKKTIDYKTGNETTVTTRTKGASVTSQAAQKQNEAKAARDKPKPVQNATKTTSQNKSVQKSKNGYKNTKRLGL